MAWFTLAMAGVAQAQAIPPRVIVIMDTSRSMKEALTTDNPAFWQTPPMDGTTGSSGADYDCVRKVGDPCTNKFCAAKKTLCEVLTGTPALNAEIALGGYYQYLESESHPANGSVQCVYDVLEPAGLRRTFTSTTDWTGSYTTLGSSGTAKDISAELGGYCQNAKYIVQKEAVLPPSGPPVDSSCSIFTSTKGAPKVFTFPMYTGPLKLTAGAVPSTCSNSTSYEVSATRQVTSNITFRNPLATSCGTVVAGAATGNPTGVATKSSTSITACASTSATGCYSGLGPGTAPMPFVTGPALGTGTTTCSAGYPCELFLTKSTPTGGRAWYGFWNSPAAPDTTSSVSIVPAYTFGTRSTASPGTNLTLTGSTAAGTACIVGGTTFTLASPNQRINNNTLLSAFGIATAKTKVEGDPGIGLTANPQPMPNGGARLDQTPTLSGTSFTCSAGWPCDVTLASITPANGTVSTAYSKDSVCSTGACTTAIATSANPCVWGNAANAGTYVTTNPSAGACAATFGATTAAIGAPQGVWASGIFTNGGTAPPVDCSTATDLKCTFNLTGAATLTPSCSTVINWNGVTTATCAPNGDQFAVATAINKTPTYVYTGLTTDTISCPASNTVTAGSLPAGYSIGSACVSTPAGGTCNLVHDAPRDTTVVDTQYTTVSAATPPGIGYTQTGVQWPNPANPTTRYAGGANGCSMTAAGGYATVNSADCTTSPAYLSCNDTAPPGDLLGLGYDVQPLGAQPVNPLGAPAGQGCGAEKNSQCYMCAYVPVRYVWKANKFTCAFNATKTTLTPKTVPGCSYTRVTYPKTQCLQQCNYQTVAKRWDFDNALYNECSYVAVSTRMQIQAQTYQYSYLTKGGELYGTWNKPVAASTVCDGTHTYGPGDPSFTSDCPALVPKCIPSASEGTPDGGAYTCKLRNSIAGTWTPPSPSFIYRYSNVVSSAYYGSTTPVTSPGVTGRYWSQPEANTDTTRKECLMGEALLAAPDDAGTLNANQSDFCIQDGGVASEAYKLFTDYYLDPAATGYTATLATLQAAIDPGTPPAINVHWSRPGSTFNRDWGLSLTLDGGAMNPSQLFVGIDNTTLPGSQVAQHSSVLQACNLPSSSRGNVTGGTTPVWDTSTSGFCMSDDSVPDFTPLYGSLKNAGDYARQLLASDNQQWQCRKYFILLATDGREDTPASLTGQAPALVGGMTTITAAGRTAQLRTYVVGIGSGAAADQTALDSIASAGGTTRAYTVTTQAALTATLRKIFDSLAAGTFTKSKPTLSTDGSRLYYASYTTSLTGERSGELQAYSFDSNGNPVWQWAASPKVNAQSDGSRVLRAATSTSAAVDFTVANANNSPPTALASRLTEAAPTGTVPTDVVRFVRNGSLNEPYNTPNFFRNERIGPIGHSNPVVVGMSPYDSSWGGVPGTAQDNFSAFVAASSNRGSRVLLGSGDGFLRAFVEGVKAAPCGTAYGPDAGSSNDSDPGCPNGREAWGFMPVEAVRTAYLMPNGQAPLGVDGPMAVADVCGNSSGAGNCGQSDWKMVVIGSERSGGNGIFVLDVSTADDAGVVGVGPGYLWGFNHNDLGLSYSAPAIGRITDATGDRFAAIFGGGLANGSARGTAIFVVDAIDGGLVEEFDGYHVYGDGSLHAFADGDQKLARPSVHRWPGVPGLFASYVPGTAGVTYALRFQDSSGNAQTSPSSWTPQVLFDPTSARNAEDVNGHTATITQVVVDATFDGGMGQPGWKLVNPSTTDGGFPYPGNTFPLGTAQVRPLLNRPRAVPVVDSRGKLPDLFFGTGDTTNPADPGHDLPGLLGSLRNWNYFMAVHDTDNEDSSRNAGRLMWAHYFIDATEQVVSEPAVISGGVIVATYTPSTNASPTLNGDGSYNCEAVGDTKLYCFDPLDGHLSNCLTYMSGPYEGRSTAVVTMGSVGIPSDLVVINNNMYFATSVGGLMRQSIRQTPPAGDVRSYRRLR